jgi:predicted dehydrogenase
MSLKFAIIGAGAIARAYAQAFENCDACGEVAAVVDVRPEAAQALAEELRCNAYDSYEEAASEELLDAVIICTPPASHPEIAVYFMARGVHVLCEKPLSIDSQSARAMLEAARQNNVCFTMASKFRYVEDVIKAKSIIASGLLGDIVLFENAFTARVDMSMRWNSQPEVSGGGVLIDNGTHSLDIMRYFLGPLEAVQVVEGKRTQGLAVEDTVRIFARSAEGVMASADLSWSINKELDTFINIYCAQGTLQIGWRESRYRQASSHDWVIFGAGYDKVAAFRGQLRNFTRAIRGEEALLITAGDGVASVEVVEAAYASLAQNNWTPIAAGDIIRAESIV